MAKRRTRKMKRRAKRPTWALFVSVIAIVVFISAGLLHLSGYVQPTGYVTYVPLNVSVDADAPVKEWFSDNNYGDSAFITIGDLGTDDEFEVYFRFDLSTAGLPDNAIIDSAKLWVWGSGSTMDTELYFVSDDTWVEDEITWNDRPARTGDSLVTRSITPEENVWMSFGSNAFLIKVNNEWLGDKKVSLNLAESPGTNDRAFVIHSKEGDHKPYLELSYHVEPFKITGTTSDRKFDIHIMGANAGRPISIQPPEGDNNITLETTPFAGILFQMERDVDEFSIAAERLTEKPIELPDPPMRVIERYFQITTSGITADDISTTEGIVIQFMIPQDWLTENDLSTDDIIMYRFNDTWEKMEVGYLAEHPDAYGTGKAAVAFEVITPGFSDFVIGGGEFVNCTETKPDIIEGDCTDQKKETTDWECDTTTGEWAELVTEEACAVCGDNVCSASLGETQETCCSDCGAPTGFECANNVLVSLEPKAKAAIDLAQVAIDAATAGDKNVTVAQTMLNEAMAAYTAGDYTTAKVKAESANTLALLAPKIERPIVTMPVLVMIISAIAAIAGIAYYTRYKPKTKRVTKVPAPK